MPPVFEQPGGNRGSSGGDHYAQLASALQSRYASDAANQMHAQLGYAQLDQQRLAQQQNFELGVAHMQLQPILQEQQARGQMDDWMMKQQFNQQDQADLNRQNSVLSELMEKRDKGDISDGEFYAQARQVAPRVNVLQAKEAHTKIAAQAEMRKQLGEQHAQEGQLISQRADLFKKTFEDRVSFLMDPTKHDLLGSQVDTLEPGLNPAAREQAIRFRAEQQGLGRHFFQEDIGKWLPLEKGLAGAHESSATGPGGAEKPPAGTMTDTQFGHLRLSIEKGLQHDAKAEEKTLAPDELKSKTDEKLKEMGLPTSVSELNQQRHPKEQAKQAAVQTKADRLDKIQALAADVQGRDDLPPEKRQHANVLLGMMQKFVHTHGIPADGTDLKKHLDKLANMYKAVVGDVAMPSVGKKVEEQPQQPGFLGGLVQRDSLVGQAIQGAQGLEAPIGGGN